MPTDAPTPEPRRRYVILSHYFPPSPSGSAKTGSHLAAELARRGHDVLVLTEATDGAAPGPDTWNGMAVRRFAPRKFRWWTLPHAPYRRAVARLDSDVVVLLHQNTWMSNQAIDLWRHIDAIRVYLPIEFDPDTSKGFQTRWTHRAWNRLVHRPLLATSHLVLGVTRRETSLLREFLAGDVRVDYVPLGLDPAAFDAPDHGTLEDRFPDLPDEFVFHVSSGAGNKRRDLAAAVADGPARDLPFVFAGSRSDEAAVRNGHRLGFVDPGALRALYARARVHLQTSAVEGFGYTFLESMAQGTPFVAGPVGEAPALVEQGGGVLVDDDAALDDAQRLRNYGDAVHKAWRQDWDADALRRIARGYTWEAFVDRLEERTRSL